jgi:hypothetical protein
MSANRVSAKSRIASASEREPDRGENVASPATERESREREIERRGNVTSPATAREIKRRGVYRKLLE